MSPRKPRVSTEERGDERAQDDLLKGTLDMLILKSLTVQSMHGYAIVRHIERLSGGVFSVEHGSLYPALERLQRNGLVSGKWGESPTGRRARYYTITAAGRRHLGERISAFDRVLAGIAGVMKSV
jgi:PadR family transcriptional regulator, regulatory protein PadR